MRRRDGAERRGIVCVYPDVVAEVTYSELMQGRLRKPVLHAIGPEATKSVRK